MTQKMAVPSFVILLTLAALPAGAGARPAKERFAQGPFESAAVAGDHPYASVVGREVLRAGGNAVDAAVAVALAEGVVRPDSAGLGGGGFLVFYDAKTKKSHALDMRETAPAAATAGMFFDEDGKPIPGASTKGGRAAAVPGLLFGLHEAWKKHGKMQWKDLFAGAIRAAQGTEVTEAFHHELAAAAGDLREDASIARVFLKDGVEPYQTGERLVQSSMVNALQALSEEGPELMRDGWIAKDLVKAVQNRAGVMTLGDLKKYRPVWRTPVVARFHGKDIISMPPPSSGGTAIVQVMAILEALDGWPSKDALRNNHYLAEAMKHAFADRARYMADPEFVKVPVREITSKSNAQALAKKIEGDKAVVLEKYGLPNLPEDHGTTHFSVLDAQGNAVALTMTINTAFGAGFVGARSGIVLNNEMDDFATVPGQGNAFGLVQSDRNAVEPGKRPLSSMSPTVVVDDGKVVMVAGASGGGQIISGTLQVILNSLVHGMSLEESIIAPRLHHQWKPDILKVEEGLSASVMKGLEEAGHKVQVQGAGSAVQAITVEKKGLHAASDPRKGGEPAGF